LHFLGCIGRGEAGEGLVVEVAELEPLGPVFLADDDGHPVVDRQHDFVRGGGEQATSVLLPGVVEGSDGERLVVLKLEEMRAFGFRPFVEAIGEDEATAFGEQSLEGALFADGFGAGVDEDAAFGSRPLRNDAPAHFLQFIEGGDDGDFLSGGDVVAGPEVEGGRERHLAERPLRLNESESPAHGRRVKYFGGNINVRSKRGKSVTPLRGFVVWPGLEFPGFRCAAPRALIPSRPPDAGKGGMGREEQVMPPA